MTNDIVKPMACTPDSAADNDDDTGPESPSLGMLHAVFEAWSEWSRSRKYYCPPTRSGTILGKLRTKSRPFAHGTPDAPCNMDLAALHLAILGQPRDALDAHVFYAYYGTRQRNIKRAAADLGISRRHFYRLLKDFCRRVYNVSLTISTYNAQQRDTLPHYESGHISIPA